MANETPRHNTRTFVGTEHVDAYPTTAWVVGACCYDYERGRRMAVEDVGRASTGELPYWNGYVYYTAVHTDDECLAHMPEGEWEMHPVEPGAWS